MVLPPTLRSWHMMDYISRKSKLKFSPDPFPSVIPSDCVGITGSWRCSFPVRTLQALASHSSGVSIWDTVRSIAKMRSGICVFSCLGHTKKPKINQNTIGCMICSIKNKFWSGKAIVDNLTHILIFSLQPQGLKTRKPTAGWKEQHSDSRLWDGIAAGWGQLVRNQLWVSVSQHYCKNQW